MCLFVVLSLAYAQSDAISPGALRQIAELLQEKKSRTRSQLKLSSRLVYALKESAGQSLTPGIASLPGALDITPRQGVLVDIRAVVSDELLSTIDRAGGRVISASEADHQVRARIALADMEAFAARSDVQFIKPAARARINGGSRVLPRVSQVESAFASLLTGHSTILSRLNPLVLMLMGSLTTQGDVTHSSNLARATYGINGAGVRVGVLSDSAEATNFLIGTGDLPPNTTIVQEITDGPGNSEGTAMMEIIYDMAPGVELFFASAFNSPSSFAANIRTLRNVYHCDVLVDDVSWSDEFPFQDGIIAQAVNDVTASGAIYFSSAGNGGNFTNGNSSVWEGDFVDAGSSTLLPGYRLHNFGGQSFNRLLVPTALVDLFWSDPIGASSNDYDLFVLNAAGTAVLGASVGNQNGTQDPIEEIFNPNGFPANSRVVIATTTGAAVRALHLEDFFGEPLQIATSGVTHGHNAGPATVSVAAVSWNSARLGTRPFIGGIRNPTETFSSDGPRKMFYDANGVPLTPHNLLFDTKGGMTFIKPDIAAADGMTVRTPGFNPFFGTSAAAPHAAGIAALIKSARPSLTPAQIRDAMISTALDIQAAGIDRDSGYGLVMAPPAVAKALQ
jgi:subtilisin family serine protease